MIFKLAKDAKVLVKTIMQEPFSNLSTAVTRKEKGRVSEFKIRTKTIYRMNTVSMFAHIVHGFKWTARKRG